MWLPMFTAARQACQQFGGIGRQAGAQLALPRTRCDEVRDHNDEAAAPGTYPCSQRVPFKAWTSNGGLSKIRRPVLTSTTETMYSGRTVVLQSTTLPAVNQNSVASISCDLQAAILGIPHEREDHRVVKATERLDAVLDGHGRLILTLP